MYEFLLDVKNKTPFVEHLIFAVFVLRIPENELLQMEFRHLEWIIDVYIHQEERLDMRNANLMSVIANTVPRKNKRAAQPKDFMPRKKKSQKDVESAILDTLGITLSKP